MDVEEICDALNKALDLEAEGYDFYMGCAVHTTNKEGQDFFKHLAKEEQVHYEEIEELYKEEFDEGYRKSIDRIQEKKSEASGVFEKNVPGGNLDRKSDALDALNIAIRAEENSIQLYQKLAEETDNPEVKKLFEKLVEEEKEHRSILEAEVEFVTGTGEFRILRR